MVLSFSCCFFLSLSKAICFLLLIRSCFGEMGTLDWGNCSSVVSLFMVSSCSLDSRSTQNTKDHTLWASLLTTQTGCCNAAQNTWDKLAISQSDWCLKINLGPTAFPPNVSFAFVYRGGKGSAGDDKPCSLPYKSLHSYPNLNKVPEMEFYSLWDFTSWLRKQSTAKCGQCGQIALNHHRRLLYGNHKSRRQAFGRAYKWDLY